MGKRESLPSRLLPSRLPSEWALGAHGVSSSATHHFDPVQIHRCNPRIDAKSSSSLLALLPPRQWFLPEPPFFHLEDSKGLLLTVMPFSSPFAIDKGSPLFRPEGRDGP